jgi:hypothetical protein
MKAGGWRLGWGWGACALLPGACHLCTAGRPGICSGGLRPGPQRARRLSRPRPRPAPRLQAAGASRSNPLGADWDALEGLALGALGALVARAPSLPRNYILDLDKCAAPGLCGLAGTGLGWLGLAGTGLGWLGLAGTGLGWLGLAWAGLGWAAAAACCTQLRGCPVPAPRRRARTPSLLTPSHLPSPPRRPRPQCLRGRPPPAPGALPRRRLPSARRRGGAARLCALRAPGGAAPR